MGEVGDESLSFFFDVTFTFSREPKSPPKFDGLINPGLEARESTTLLSPEKIRIRAEFAK